MKAEGKKHKRAAAEIKRYWLQNNKFRMLSRENQLILKMKRSDFYCALPEDDDLVNFDLACKSDRASVE